MEKKGFTLIELLIVITIIGVLAVALLPRIVGIPARGRDTARIAALNQIVTALQTYYNDNGSFPALTSGGCLPANNIQNYMGGAGSVPTDPQPARSHLACSTGGAYYYKSLTSADGTANQAFVLAADLESDGYGQNYYNSTAITGGSFTSVSSKPANIQSTDSPAITGTSNIYAIIR